MIASTKQKDFVANILSAPEPVLVSFWAPWCGPCRIIDPLLNQLQNRAEMPISVVRVNIDENFWFAKTYQIQNIPAILLFHQGKVISRLEHVKSREEFFAHFQRALGQVAVPTP